MTSKDLLFLCLKPLHRWNLSLRHSQEQSTCPLSRVLTYKLETLSPFYAISLTLLQHISVKKCHLHQKNIRPVHQNCSFGQFIQRFMNEIDKSLKIKFPDFFHGLIISTYIHSLVSFLQNSPRNQLHTNVFDHKSFNTATKVCYLYQIVSAPTSTEQRLIATWLLKQGGARFSTDLNL